MQLTVSSMILVFILLLGMSSGYRIDYNKHPERSELDDDYENKNDDTPYGLQRSSDYDYDGSSEEDGENEGSFLDEVDDHSELDGEEEETNEGRSGVEQSWNGPVAQPPGYQANGAPLPVQDLPEVTAEKQRHLQLYSFGPHAAAVAAGQPPQGNPVHGGYATPWVPLVRLPIVNQYQPPVYSFG